MSILDKNIYFNHDQHHWKQNNQLPFLQIIIFATDASDDHPFSWYTDVIPFVMHNYTTSIISNKHRLFNGQFKPMRVTLETTEGLTTLKKLVGNLRLVLTGNINDHHIYNITQCIFDPKSPLNIIGVLDLGTFFGDNTVVHCPLAEHVTTVKYGATK